jgi:hypothetical protein
LTGLFYASQIPNDFNGDGRSDVLFRSASASSALATWQLDDTSITGGGALSNPGSAWTYQGDGDFYGNVHSDILFQDASGNLSIWEMNGGAIVGGGGIGSPGSGFAVAGIADLGNTSHASIVFDNASGQVATWLMNDTSIIGGGTIGTAAGYAILGVR